MTYLMPLPVAVPLLMAAALLALQKWLPRWLIDGLATLTALAVAVLCALLFLRSASSPLVYWFGGWRPRHGVALGISFAVDPFGAVMATLAAVLTTASMVYSWRFFKEIGTLFSTLMLVFLAAMVGFSLTGDIFNMFVFFELMSVAAYVLTGYKVEEEQALEGSLSFAVTNSVGALFVLLGISLLYARTGALNLAQIGATLTVGRLDGLVIVAFVLIVSGFGVKSAIVPFHFWLDDAHAVAPTPVCVLFSGVMVELGLYAIWRIYVTVFQGILARQPGAVEIFFIVLGCVTTVLGAVMCLGQRHLKRLLAFSTISHAGVILIGIGLLSPRSIAGAFLYIVAHGMVKGALFICAGILLNRFESVDENELHGKGRPLVLTGTIFGVAALALSGLPPFGTFLGKSIIEEAAAHSGREWLNFLTLLTSAMTGAAALRAGAHIFLGWGAASNVKARTPSNEEAETKEKYRHAPAVMILPAAALLAGALALGFVGGEQSRAEDAAQRALSRPAYVDRVLNDQVIPLPERTETPPDRLPGILFGLAASILAILIGGGGALCNRLSSLIRTCAERVLEPIMQPLRSFHSGHVCDYVAWIAIGACWVGMLCAGLYWHVIR